MSTEIIIAIIAASAAIIVAYITNFLNKNNALKFEKRKLKETYYTQFIKAFSDNLNLDDQDDRIKSLCYAHNNLLLIADVSVINKLQSFDEMIINNGQNYEIKKGIKRGTEEYINEYNKRLRELMISIRLDLYGKDKKSYPTVFFKSNRK